MDPTIYRVYHCLSSCETVCWTRVVHLGFSFAPIQLRWHSFWNLDNYVPSESLDFSWSWILSNPAFQDLDLSVDLNAASATAEEWNYSSFFSHSQFSGRKLHFFFHFICLSFWQNSFHTLSYNGHFMPHMWCHSSLVNCLLVEIIFVMFTSHQKFFSLFLQSARYRFSLIFFHILLGLVLKLWCLMQSGVFESP